MTILVTYASRSGSTAEIAEAIGESLTKQGLSVVVRPMTEVTEVAQYQAVVAGSAVRQQQWLPEAMQFLEAHQHELFSEGDHRDWGAIHEWANTLPALLITDTVTTPSDAVPFA